MALHATASLLQVTFGILTQIFMLSKNLGYEYKNGKWRISAVLVFAFFAVGAPFLLTDLETADLIAELVVTMFFAFSPYVLFRSEKKLTFFFSGLTLCAVFDFITFGISSVFVRLPRVYVLFVYSGVYLLSLAMLHIAYKKRSFPAPERFLEQISYSVYIVVYIANFATFYSIEENNDPEYFSDVGNALMLLSVVLVVCCLSFAFYRYATLSRVRMETEKALGMQLKHYEDMVAKNRDIRSFRHDYVNNLISVQALLKNGNNEEALEYVEKLSQTLALTQSRFSTGNYLADAILSDKASKAESVGAILTFSGSVPNNGISNNDLCTVLSNVLDNAIRGIQNVAEPEIKVVSDEDENGFVLTVSNPISENIEIKNNKIRSTKQDNENHGFGIELIKKTVKKYNGFTTLSCKNMIFEIQAGFILKKGEYYEKDF